MTANSIEQIVAFLVVLVGLAIPIGAFIAQVLSGRDHALSRILGPLERLIYRSARVQNDREMSWRGYASALLVFHVLGFAFVYLLQRIQQGLGLNPDGLGAVAPQVAFNTAVSFVTNTNWQAYGGETTMSYLTQMLALTVQNFVSAASGLAVLAVLIRGFARERTNGIGNFWVDLTRGTVHVLLPLSLLLALALVGQGAVQTLGPSARATFVEPFTGADGVAVTEQILAVGPAASQVAIKQLGTNGGGFFNANSAHPFENPTPLSNFLEVLAILILPAALCFTFGAMIRDRRQAWALLAAMLVIFVPIAGLTVSAEQAGNPHLASLGVDQAPGAGTATGASGGNMEGKETRFGVTNSALWAITTTAASNGSVNAMHDSFTPLGGLWPMWMMQLGEVIFGGVGSGLYGLILYALVAVFLAGLMVGRTPEYLGKKIEAYEMKMASVAILLPSAAVLVGTALACLSTEARGAILNPGAHGFSEILYAFSSGSNNNGSAFGGLTVNGNFYAIAIGVAMWIGRFGVLIPVLAIAGSLARKKHVPPSSGTLPTHSPLFVALLAGTVVLVGALTFLPALALGPIVEHVTRLTQ